MLLVFCAMNFRDLDCSILSLQEVKSCSACKRWTLITVHRCDDIGDSVALDSFPAAWVCTNCSIPALQTPIWILNTVFEGQQGHTCIHITEKPSIPLNLDSICLVPVIYHIKWKPYTCRPPYKCINTQTFIRSCKKPCCMYIQQAECTYNRLSGTRIVQTKTLVCSWFQTTLGTNHTVVAGCTWWWS